MAGDDNRSHISSVLDGSTSNEVEPGIADKHANAPLDSQAPPPLTPMSWAVPPGPAPAATAAPGSGGGYQFDAETIDQLIRDWQQIVDDIEADEIELRMAQMNVVRPSGDIPASDNAEATLNSIQAAIDQNISMRKYAQSWLDALRKANGTYVENDEETGKGLSGAGGAADGHALFS